VIVHGMEPLTWDKDLQLDHIKTSDFKKEKRAYKKAHESWAKTIWHEVKSIIF
jgi:hypothetical protein